MLTLTKYAPAERALMSTLGEITPGATEITAFPNTSYTVIASTTSLD